VVEPTLTIGDFSRATHLSVKMLRHYHDIGLLEPADVDPDTGYRRYGTAQIATAQVIRRFRDLDMPLEEIHAVLSAPDPSTRNRLISAHLARLEAGLARTQDAVATLRGLLKGPPAQAPIRHRHASAVSAAAVTETVERADALAWYQGALGELHAVLAAQHISPAGPGGGIFQTELFTEERGEATIFLPCQAPPRPMGRVTAFDIPEVEIATHHPPGPARRHRPGLRHTRRLRHQARPRCRRPPARVLPHRPHGHPRPGCLAHRNRMAHLRDRRARPGSRPWAAVITAAQGHSACIRP
jgi:DNA-binding transcriptional MerR regulator